MRRSSPGTPSPANGERRSTHCRGDDRQGRGRSACAGQRARGVDHRRAGRQSRGGLAADRVRERARRRRARPSRRRGARAAARRRPRRHRRPRRGAAARRLAAAPRAAPPRAAAPGPHHDLAGESAARARGRHRPDDGRRHGTGRAHRARRSDGRRVPRRRRRGSAQAASRRPPARRIAGRRIGGAETTEIKVIGLRRLIAERMSEAKRTIPHFAYVEEVDVTELESLRQHLNAKLAKGEPSLSYLPLIVIGPDAGAGIVSAMQCAVRRGARRADSPSRRACRHRHADSGWAESTGGAQCRSRWHCGSSPPRSAA